MANIHKYLDLSLAHITYGDSQLLDRFSKNTSTGIINRQAFRLVVYEYEYGYFIPLTKIEADYMSTLRLFGYSEAFIKLIEYASEKECSLICLDRDAEPIDCLEKFEW